MLYKWNLDKTSPANDKKLNTFYHHFTKTGHDNEVAMGPFSKYSQNYINTLVILRSQETFCPKTKQFDLHSLFFRIF